MGVYMIHSDATAVGFVFGDEYDRLCWEYGYFETFEDAFAYCKQLATECYQDFVCKQRIPDAKVSTKETERQLTVVIENEFKPGMTETQYYTFTPIEMQKHEDLGS